MSVSLNCIDCMHMTMIHTCDGIRTHAPGRNTCSLLSQSSWSSTVDRPASEKFKLSAGLSRRVAQRSTSTTSRTPAAFAGRQGHGTSSSSSIRDLCRSAGRHQGPARTLSSHQRFEPRACFSSMRPTSTRADRLDSRDPPAARPPTRPRYDARGCTGFVRSRRGRSARRMDGITAAERRTAHVPAGLAGWELGTSSATKAKADDDYAKRTANPGE